MNVIIDETRPGVQWAAQQAKVSVVDYIEARIADIQKSWDDAYAAYIQEDNRQFFELAARLPQPDRDEIRDAVLAKAQERGLL
jgi:hypothetical protein